MPSLRRLNIQRSVAAGVAVGAYSEIDRPPAIGKSAKDWSRKNKAASKKRSKRSRLSRREMRVKEDALSGWRRVPGSFENGQKR